MNRSRVLDNLTVFAEQRGMSVEQAIADYEWRFHFSLFAQQVRERAPEAFTYSAATGPQQAEIWFSGDTPREALALLDEFKRFFPQIDVDVRGGVGLNEREINSALSAAHFAVYDEAGDAVSMFNYETMEIEITVPKSADARSGELVARANGAMADALPQGHAGVKVTLDVSSLAALSEDDTSSSHYGGELLNSGDCCSGPAFRNSSTGSRRGSTASHCDDTLTDDGDTLTWTQDYDGHWGDWQLHYGPDWESDNFCSGSGTVTETSSRDTSSGGVPSVGQTLCKNGRTTHKTCAEVLNPSICVGDNCFLIEMDDDISDPGDSGGIVHNWRTVYRAHEGTYKKYFWSDRRSTFSRQDSVHEIWNNWYIATS